jgi:hypothetical protein
MKKKPGKHQAAFRALPRDSFKSPRKAPKMVDKKDYLP